MKEPGLEPAGRRIGWALAFLSASGFAIRLYYSGLRGSLQNWDSAVYVRLAENLFKGYGFREWADAPVHTWFQPLYPILMSMANHIVGDIERSGYVVSSLFGALLAIPAYLLASSLYTRQVGMIAAVLTTLSFRMIDASTLIITEMPYTFFWMMALFLASRVLFLEKESRAGCLGIGLLLGIAGLLRTEAVFYFLVILPVCGTVLFLRGRSRSESPVRAITLAGLLALGYFIPQVPYFMFLESHLGHFTVTGKSAYTVLAILQAPSETYQIIDKSPFALVLGDPIFAVNRILTNLDIILRKHSIWAFTPPLVILMGNSFLGRRWEKGRMAKEAFMAAMFVLPWISIYGVTGILNRYYYSYIAIGLIWAAKGVANISYWVDASDGLFTALKGRYWTVASLVVVSFLLSSAQQAARPILGGGFPEQAQEAKDAEIGGWIRKNGRDSARVMCVSPRIAYYANARHYGDSRQAMGFEGLREYIKENRIDFLVADDFFTRQWFPGLVGLEDTLNCPPYLSFVKKIGFQNDSGEPGYANIYKAVGP